MLVAIINAKKMGIQTDVLIGDFDSCKEKPDVKCKNFIQLPTEKDVTDTMACVEYAIKLGYSDFHFFCCTGGRLDHFFSNVFILEYLENRGLKGTIYDDFNIISVLSKGKHHVKKADKMKYLSLIALDNTVSGVTLAGVKYTLFEHTLYREFALGVSNEFVDPIAVITIDDGRCLLIQSRDRYGI